MKKALITILIVAVAAALINDIGRYARARYDLGIIAQDTAENVSMGTKGAARDANAVAAANYAATRGATVYLYDQDDQKVHVWVEMPVEGTWIWAPLAAWQSGEPEGTPLMIQAEHSSNRK